MNMPRFLFLIALCLPVVASAQEHPSALPPPQLTYEQQELYLNSQLNYLKQQRHAILDTDAYYTYRTRKHAGIGIGAAGFGLSLFATIINSALSGAGHLQRREQRAFYIVEFGALAAGIGGISLMGWSIANRPFRTELRENATEQNKVKREIHRIRDQRVQLLLSATQANLTVTF